MVVYELCWTEDILAEAIYQFRKSHPTVRRWGDTKLRDTIAASLEGGRIDDYVIDGSFPGSDPDDQHVHAAAIAAGATYLITADGGFTSPGIDLDSLPYEKHTPDSLLVLVDDSAPHLVRAVTRAQERSWDQRPRSKTLPQALQDAGCPDFAQRVLEHLCQLPADETNA